MRAKNLLTYLTTPLFQFIYPPVCFACEKPLANTIQQVCAACWATIRTVTPDNPLYLEKRGQLIRRGDVQGLVSSFHFEKGGTLQTLIHQLKYGGMKRIGVMLGERAGDHVLLLSGGMRLDGVVVVPLHPTKLRERGYNQSEFIAEGIGRTTGLRAYPRLVKRRKYTQSQTQLNAEERRRNVADAFEVNAKSAGLIRGKSFLVVDDVITTGATIEACARVLKNNGAGSIVACSVALAELGADSSTMDWHCSNSSACRDS